MDKKKELKEWIASDEKLRQALKGAIKEKRVTMDDENIKQGLKELEVINDNGELIVSAIDIRDMLEEARKKKETGKNSNPNPKNFGVSVDYLEKWENMLENGEDMLSYFAEQVNPKVYGLAEVKKAIVLALASTGDKWGDRGRLHVLMYGPPGTAKSTLGEWLVHNLGIEGISHRSSDVGLTGAAVGKEVHPGALPAADGSALYIDERI